MRARSSLALALIVLAGCSDTGTPDSDGDADAADDSPSVAFVEPAAGAAVDNPVTFKIAAHNLDEVEVFADESYSLGAAWDPTARDQLTYRFAQTGIPRAVHV